MDKPGLTFVARGGRFQNSKSCMIFLCAVDGCKVSCYSAVLPVPDQLIFFLSSCTVFLWLSLVSFQVLWLCLARRSIEKQHPA